MRVAAPLHSPPTAARATATAHLQRALDAVEDVLHDARPEVDRQGREGALDDVAHREPRGVLVALDRRGVRLQLDDLTLEGRGAGEGRGGRGDGVHTAAREAWAAARCRPAAGTLTTMRLTPTRTSSCMNEPDLRRGGESGMADAAHTGRPARAPPP